MSEPKGKRAAGTKRPKGSTANAVSLGTARRMLPLVAHIANEIQNRWDRLSILENEQADLDHRRRRLEWPERARRYQIAEDIAAEQRFLQDAIAELEQVQVVLVDPAVGEVAFPTIINGRRGYFIWKTGQPDLVAWCFANDTERHKIPSSWKSY